MWKLNPLINGRYPNLLANRELLVKHGVFTFFVESEHIIYEKL